MFNHHCNLYSDDSLFLQDRVIRPSDTKWYAFSAGVLNRRKSPNHFIGLNANNDDCFVDCPTGDLDDCAVTRGAEVDAINS